MHIFWKERECEKGRGGVRIGDGMGRERQGEKEQVREDSREKKRL
jgi:hypothetical protein